MYIYKKKRFSVRLRAYIIIYLRFGADTLFACYTPGRGLNVAAKTNATQKPATARRIILNVIFLCHGLPTDIPSGCNSTVATSHNNRGGTLGFDNSTHAWEVFDSIRCVYNNMMRPV